MLFEIQKTCWDHMRKGSDTPKEITMSRKAYDALMREASSWVYMHGETGPDGLVVPGKETVYGMEISVVGDDDGFFVVGGTLNRIGKDRRERHV